MSSAPSRIWQLKGAVDPSFLDQFKNDFDPVVLQLLWNRGLQDRDSIEAFLGADPAASGHDPFLFRDMAAAVDLVIGHVKDQEKIVVYGDYDADGVSASALLVETLGTLKANVDIYIPERVAEGYGLNPEAVEKIAATGAKLIVTVDCGVRSYREVAYARSLGLEVVITDHHVPASERAQRPDCLIINPTVEGERYPYHLLSGVGVAYKLAQALIARSRLTDEQKTLLTERILDLVAIGTVADCVDLMGENRVLVKAGLKVLSTTTRPGVRELLMLAGIWGKNLDAWNIGFQVGPRLNAAGRMGSANTAYELLITRDRAESLTLARQLNDRNQERQQDTEAITAAVEAQIKLSADDRIVIGICPASATGDARWNEGVIGLVAGKIANKYHLPALVITHAQDGYKGSGRSVPGYNIVRALEENGTLLVRYGGHPAACGFSLSADKLDEFVAAMKRSAKQALKDTDLRPIVRVDADLPLKDVTDELAGAIEAFAPFGQNNDQPVFMATGVTVAGKETMGLQGQHLKIRLLSGQSAVFTALGFGRSEEWAFLEAGATVDIAYFLERNTWNGRTELRLRLVDIRPASV